MLNLIEAQLKGKYPEDIVDELIKSYKELKEQFYLGKYKPSELEGGFFVECVRRIVEIELFNNVIPIGTNLPNFNDVEMKRYENASGDEAFRLHIPRILRSIYNLRNKRGVGHLSKVSPNIIDSTYIVSSCDWVMAEIIRQVSSLSTNECQKIVDSMVQRKMAIVFEDGDIQRVLETKYNIKQQVLILLYHNTQPVADSLLLKWTEYTNSSLFKSKILSPIHKERIIEYRDGICQLTPKGILYVEDMLSQVDTK